MVVSLLQNIVIQYETKMFYSFFWDTSIHIQIAQMAVQSVLHDIFLSW